MSPMAPRPREVTIVANAELTDEELTIRQEKAAEVLADGGTRAQAASAAGVTWRTIERWCNEPQWGDFQAYTVELRRSLQATRRAKREKVVRMALDVMAEVLAGERDYSDDRAREARDILRDTEWRVYLADGHDPGAAVVRRGSA